MKYEVDRTSKFKKDLKRAIKRGCDIERLRDVVGKLQNGEQLPEKSQDHALHGNWENYRECHIAPDWLLIYRYFNDVLVLSLTRTGTHSELFNK